MRPPANKGIAGSYLGGTIENVSNECSGSIRVPYKHVSRVGFKLPLIDDNSYEANTLPTKAPRPDWLNPSFTLARTKHKVG